jgi:poly(A) polymerase
VRIAAATVSQVARLWARMLGGAMTPTERTGAPLVPVEPVAAQLGQRFADAGHRLYLVGGSVRDAIMGRPTTGELDFATDAHPEATIRILQGWARNIALQGIRFGTVGAKKDGALLEITTFRKEVYPEDDRHPHVTFADELEVDLSRRDFTVNAMAVGLPSGEFIDPFGGVRALASRALDTPLDPHVSFGDDPLRMLRAARFSARLELRLAPRVGAAMREMASRLSIVSAERVNKELSLLLQAPDPTAGLVLIVETGLADVFLPELPALRLEQDPVHRHKDVLRHTIAVVQRCDADDLTLRLAALMHDIGKPATREFTVDGVRFHHHEEEGARLAARRLKELRYPNAVVDDVTQLVRLHLRFHSYKEGWSDAALRRYVRDAGGPGPQLDRLNALVRADCTTRNEAKAKALAALQDDLELRIARLVEEESLEQLRPPLDGNQVMAHLGLQPGRDVGRALEYLLELRIERGPIGEEDAYVLLDAWAAERGVRGENR